MVFGGLELFGKMSVSGRTNKEKSNKETADDHAHNHDDNNDKETNKETPSATDHATYGSDVFGDAASSKNHSAEEHEQSKDSAVPPSSSDSQQSKHDATSNVDKDAFIVTTTEGTLPDLSPAVCMRDDTITGSDSVVEGVTISTAPPEANGKNSTSTTKTTTTKTTASVSNASSSVNETASKEKNTNEIEDSAVDKSSSGGLQDDTITGLDSVLNGVKTTTATPANGKNTSTTKTTTATTASVNAASSVVNENASSAVNETPNDKSIKRPPGPRRSSRRHAQQGNNKKLLLIEIIQTKEFFEFEDVPADGHCLFHALIKLCPFLEKDPWKLRSEMVQFVCAGMLHGQKVLSDAQIANLKYLINEDQRDRGFTVDKWAKRMVKKSHSPLWCGNMELCLFTLMYGVAVDVITNVNNQILRHEGDKWNEFFPKSKEIFDCLWKNKSPMIGPKRITILAHCFSRPMEPSYDGGLMTDHYGALIPRGSFVKEEYEHYLPLPLRIDASYIKPPTLVLHESDSPDDAKNTLVSAMKKDGSDTKKTVSFNVGTTTTADGDPSKKGGKAEESESTDPLKKGGKAEVYESADSAKKGGKTKDNESTSQENDATKEDKKKRLENLAKLRRELSEAKKKLLAEAAVKAAAAKRTQSKKKRKAEDTNNSTKAKKQKQEATSAKEKQKQQTQRSEAAQSKQPKKRKRLPKRKNWSFSRTVNQLKDEKNRLKANEVLFNLQMLQRQTTYHPKMDRRDEYPSCKFILIGADDVIPNPSQNRTGLVTRSQTYYPVLAPKGMTQEDVGRMLINLGNAMVKKGKNAKTSQLLDVKFYHEADEVYQGLYDSVPPNANNIKNRKVLDEDAEFFEVEKYIPGENKKPKTRSKMMPVATEVKGSRGRKGTTALVDPVIVQTVDDSEDTSSDESDDDH